MTKLQTSQPPEAFLAYLVKKLEHDIRHVFERRLREQGAAGTFASLAVLTVLAAGERPSGAELARRCLVTPQSMNGVLHGMEQEQWVKQRPRPGSAREAEWALTTRGRHVLAKAQEVLLPIVATLEGTLNPDELAVVKGALSRLIDALARLDTQAVSAGSQLP